MDKIELKISTNRHTGIRQCIAENKRHLVSKLAVLGTYASDYDNKTIQEMCNTRTADGQFTGGNLEILDLSNAEIAANFHCGYVTNSGSMGIEAFKDCITLREVIFGESLLSTSARYYSGCLSLSSIKVSVGNRKYKSINGVLYDILDSSILPNKARKNGEWIIVKVPAMLHESNRIDFSCANEIADYAFEDTSIRELKLPEIPPICSKEAFKGVDAAKLTLIVPMGALNNYWSHPVWGSFNIKESHADSIRK